MRDCNKNTLTSHGYKTSDIIHRPQDLMKGALGRKYAERHNLLGRAPTAPPGQPTCHQKNHMTHPQIMPLLMTKVERIASAKNRSSQIM